GCDGRRDVRHVRMPDETFAAYGEVVWSWRRDPGATPAGNPPAGNGGKKGRSPGRARISRKTIARGKPGCPGCTCQIRVRLLATVAHGAAGAVGARLSLRPLYKEGQRICRTRVKSRRGNEDAYPNVVPAPVSAKASPGPRTHSAAEALA